MNTTRGPDALCLNQQPSLPDTTYSLTRMTPKKQQDDENVLEVDSGDSHRLVNVDLSRGNMYTLKWWVWDFPDSLVVKTCASTAKGRGLISGQKSKIPHALRCSQIYKWIKWWILWYVTCISRKLKNRNKSPQEPWKHQTENSWFPLQKRPLVEPDVEGHLQ